MWNLYILKESVIFHEVGRPKIMFATVIFHLAFFQLNYWKWILLSPLLNKFFWINSQHFSFERFSLLYWSAYSANSFLLYHQRVSVFISRIPSSVKGIAQSIYISSQSHVNFNWLSFRSQMFLYSNPYSSSWICVLYINYTPEFRF